MSSTGPLFRFHKLVPGTLVYTELDDAMLVESVERLTPNFSHWVSVDLRQLVADVQYEVTFLHLTLL